MKSRVIFLDDEPKTNQRLRDLLEQKGYETVVPSSIDDAFQEINMRGADIIIHCAHKTKTFWPMMDAIYAQYPEFPAVHFSTGNQSDGYVRSFKGHQHQQLRPLVPEKIFLKTVRKLIFTGRLQRENAALKKSLSLQKRIDPIFDCLEVESLKATVAGFFNQEFKGKNTYFLSLGDYGFFLQEMWKVTQINPDLEHIQNDKHLVVSAKTSSDEELSQYINKMTPYLPTGWEIKKEKLYMRAQGGLEFSFTLIPILGPRSQKTLGHVLIIDPTLYGDQGLEKSLGYVNSMVGRHLEQVMSLYDAKSLSYIDDLTELYNQRYLKLVLDKEINRAQRASGSFSVLFMDIDYFKNVNDTEGHLVGSKVLIEVSKILHQNIRSHDYGFRYGGDEFMMILVGSGSEKALTVAERIRKQVEESVFDIDGRPIKLTISIGIATYPDHAQNKEQIIELADRAMYCGKKKSRNIVYVAS